MTDSVMTINPEGDKTWYNAAGEIHRDGGPAVENADGTKEWWVDGKRHRENGPAIEYHYGAKVWYREGRLHREDGPAVVHAENTKEWYLNDRRHRLDGPAIERSDGTTEYWRNGRLWPEGGEVCRPLEEARQKREEEQRAADLNRAVQEATQTQNDVSPLPRAVFRPKKGVAP